MLDRRACAHHDDLVQHLMAGGARSRMYANFLLVIDAGQVTTTHLTPTRSGRCCASRTSWSCRAASRAVLPAAAHELMRYDSSVQFTSRIATADLTIDGHTVRAGQPVTLLRLRQPDPERFADPDRLDVTRDARGQLSFGHGRHYCLGAPLGLAEIEIVLAALTTRLRNLRLTATSLRWHQSINFRFLRELPVSFQLAA